jgi:RNA-splicing ligase RtcB
MFEIMLRGGKPVKMWLPDGGAYIEDEARQQLARVSRLPFVTNVACMPDVHVGKGATIGSVIGTERAIIPAAVGVDGLNHQEVNEIVTLTFEEGRIAEAIRKRLYERLQESI